MLKSRDCFKDMKEKRTYSYPLKCCNHLSEDLNIKIFWVGGMPLCPPRMVCLRRTSTYLGLSPNTQIVFGFLRLNLYNS